MAYLEAAKQENFPKETLNVWFVEMRRRGWTNETFRQRIAAVLSSKTYGSIKFDDFLLSKEFYSEEEIKYLVDREIKKRREEYIKSKNYNVSDEELASLGLIQVQNIWQRRFDEAVEIHAKRFEKKFRTLRAQYFKLPPEAKKILVEIASKKGLIQVDQYAEQILPLLIPKMAEEFETVIKNYSTISENQNENK